MNIILFGPPGAGKGTQAKNIAKKFNLYNISSGELLRNEIKKDSQLGRRIKSIIDKGSLVSDEIINKVIEKILIDKKYTDRLVFDGYPRNLKQAENLDFIIKKNKQKISCALNLDVDKKSVLKRILGRQNCSNCGQGNGTLEVDYQDTSNDFWPIANSHRPIAVVTFSRGYNNLSWELEFNAYNRTNWIGDYSAPTLPTPNPPDEDEESLFLRNSNLPMNQIVENINNLNIGLDPYIDQNGDPGHFVSEFMAYHGTWYRDLNLSGEENCITAGHVHVGGQINWTTARIATEETLRTVINYLNEFNYSLGDLNDDETVDILDLVIIMNFILGNIELSQIQLLAADLNVDETINVQDIIIVINIILNNS